MFHASSLFACFRSLLSSDFRTATIIQLSGRASGFAWAGVGCCRAAELLHRPYLIVLIYPLRQFVLSGAAWPAFIRAEKEKTIFMQVIRAQMNAKEFLLNALHIMILLSTSDVLLLYDTAATKVTHDKIPRLPRLSPAANATLGKIPRLFYTRKLETIKSPKFLKIQKAYPTLQSLDDGVSVLVGLGLAAQIAGYRLQNFG